MWPYLHICCTRPWITFPCDSFFLHILVLQPYIWDLVFIVSCFWLTLFSRTNEFLSWGPCIPYLIYWNCKILSQVCIIMVGHQMHVTSSNLHLSHIYSWSSCTSNSNYTWSCSCSTCLSLHLDFLVFNLTPHTCLWVTSMLYMHYHWNAPTTQKVYMSGWLSGNNKPWFFLHKYSVDTDNILHLILW